MGGKRRLLGVRTILTLVKVRSIKVVNVNIVICDIKSNQTQVCNTFTLVYYMQENKNPRKCVVKPTLRVGRTTWIISKK